MAQSVQKSLLLAFFFLNLALPALSQGNQFITGDCTSDADCESGCCGFDSGTCAGPVIAQERDGGCGFGDDEPNDTAAQALNAGSGGSADDEGDDDGSADNEDADDEDADDEGAGDEGADNGGDAADGGAGAQFITGDCTSDADCQSGCCGFDSGTCAGPVVAQERDGGCGFGDDEPNDTAAQALKSRSLRYRRFS